MNKRPANIFLLTALAFRCHAQAPTPHLATSGIAVVDIAPRSNKIVAHATLLVDPRNALSHEQKLALIQKKIKYVFVLFQENRSFDFYFGSYPGADGLFSKPSSDIPGFVQPIVNVDGTVSSISPFRIPATVTDAHGNVVPLYPQDTSSVNHSHITSVAKLHLDAADVAANDRYAVAEEGIELKDGKPSHAPTLARKQMGELVMAHVDCDTVPFLWQYADRFSLFDHFMDTVIGPSGPNAIAMIAGQSGTTQWMLHPELAELPTGSTMPMTNNPHPMWDDLLGPIAADKKHPRSSTPEANMTYATLPLSFMGDGIKATDSSDRDAGHDLLDVQDDIDKIAGHGVGAVNWGWYQQGYGHEPSDPTAAASHVGYVAHHNGPQYFGYIANNPNVAAHLHGLQDFFDDVTTSACPPPASSTFAAATATSAACTPSIPTPGSPRSTTATTIIPAMPTPRSAKPCSPRRSTPSPRAPTGSRASSSSPTTKATASTITFRPECVPTMPKGSRWTRARAFPFLLISPYAVAHSISHEPTEHSSIIKFVDELFGLVPLADLPDEERARQIGVDKLGQKDLGPADDKVEGVGDLFSGLDDGRLRGARPALAASYATISPADLMHFPHRDGGGCRSLNIRPTDTGLPNPIPVDFNPRPDTTPGIPTSGTWTP